MKMHHFLEKIPENPLRVRRGGGGEIQISFEHQLALSICLSYSCCRLNAGASYGAGGVRCYTERVTKRCEQTSPSMENS